MTVAIIPARGGSKRIPRKNLLPFCGQPILAYSIQAAQESSCFDRVLVSTDDPEIASLAKQLGAEVPFERPAELANDFATTVDVIGHAVEWLTKSKYQFDYACCIYATAPMIRATDLSAAFELIKTTEFEYVFPATTFPYSIFRAIRKSETGKIGMFFPEYMQTRSQDLPEALHDAGQFYWGRVRSWINRASIFSERSTTITIPRDRVQDIDSLEDWEFAESLFRVLKAEGHDKS